MKFQLLKGCLSLLMIVMVSGQEVNESLLQIQTSQPTVENPNFSITSPTDMRSKIKSVKNKLGCNESNDTRFNLSVT